MDPSTPELLLHSVQWLLSCLVCKCRWTAGPDQSIWGTPEDIYVKVKQGYDAAGIPIKGWEPDNNFVVDYKPIKNWIGVDWNVKC